MKICAWTRPTRRRASEIIKAILAPIFRLESETATLRCSKPLTERYTDMGRKWKKSILEAEISMT